MKWDLYNPLAPERLVLLTPCAEAKESLTAMCSNHRQQHPSEERVIKLVKRNGLLLLSAVHPSILSQVKLQSIASAFPRNERVQLSVSLYLRRHGDLVGAERVLDA